MVLDWSPFRPSLRCGYISLLARINGFMHCEWTGGGCSLWRSRDCRLQPGIDASRSLFMVRSNSLFFPNWSHSCSQSCSTTPLFGLVLPIFFLLDPPFLPKSHLWSFSHVAFSFFLFLENFLSLKKKNSSFHLYLPHKTILIYSHERPSFMPWIHPSKTAVVPFHECLLHLPVNSTYMEKKPKNHSLAWKELASIRVLLSHLPKYILYSFIPSKTLNDPFFQKM